MDSFIATIMAWGPNFAPRGWTFCNGQILSISQFTAVFSLIGTTFGGDGRTTFGIPDLRGRTPIGVGTGPGLPSYTWGQKVGTVTHNMSVVEMPSHTHTAALSDLQSVQPASTEAADTDTPGPDTVPALANFEVRGTTTNVNAYVSGSSNTTLSPGVVTGNAAVGHTGGSQAFSLMQPSLALHYIFCMQGIYPPRN